MKKLNIFAENVDIYYSRWEGTRSERRYGLWSVNNRIRIIIYMRMEAAKGEQERCLMCVGCRFFVGNKTLLLRNQKEQI